MYKPALTKLQKDHIVSLFTNDLVSAVDIGKQYDRCKGTIYTVLHEYDVDLENAHKVKVACEHCGRKYWKYRAHYKRTRADYCNRKCRGNAERKIKGGLL